MAAVFQSSTSSRAAMPASSGWMAGFFSVFFPRFLQREDFS